MSPFGSFFLTCLLLQSGITVQPFFGPENVSARAPDRGARADNDDSSTATTRKHARDSLVNGIPVDASSLSAQAPAAKRSRRSNGQTPAANGASRGAKSGDAMDIDESSTKREPASTSSPSATGASQHVANAQDTEMDMDSGESKTNLFHRGAQGELAETMTGATNSVHVMAASANANANLGAGGGGRASSEAGSAIAAATGTVAGSSAAGNFNNGEEPVAGTSPAAAAAAAPDTDLSLPNAHGEQLHDQQHQQQQQQQIDQQLEDQVQAQAQTQIQVIATLKDGRSVGVQSDKVTDLGPETAVLRVPGKNVTHALWSPRDPALLATGGDALCRLWALPTNPTASLGLARSAQLQQPHPHPHPHPHTHTRHSNPDVHQQSSTSPNGHVNGNTNGNGANGSNANNDSAAAHVLNLDPSSIVDLYDASPDSKVTAMAWSPDGAQIAVAMSSQAGGRTGEVTIHSKSGTLIDELPGGMETVTHLSWNPSGSLLLGISHSDENNSTLMVWELVNSLAIEPFNLDSAILDATWLDDRSFMICGDNLIAETSVQESMIGPLRARTDLGDSREWSQICYDAVTQTTAIAACDSGVLALLDASGALHFAQAHAAQITALKFQPLANPNALAYDAPRLFATGGEDGSIKLWDAKKPIELVHELELGKESQTLALSFTPDGYLIAAASWGTILFWNAEAGGAPRAAWDGSKVGWQLHGAGINGHRDAETGDVAMTDDDDAAALPSLSWDADGGKIAFGIKEQVRRDYGCAFEVC